MRLKIIAFLLGVGTMGALEIERIGWTQAVIQLLLAIALFVIAEQTSRINQLKDRLYGRL